MVAAAAGQVGEAARYKHCQSRHVEGAVLLLLLLLLLLWLHNCRCGCYCRQQYMVLMEGLDRGADATSAH
jgi:hypothetical protein